MLLMESSIIFDSGGTGKDWAIYKIFSNTNTGLLPAVAQNSFIRTTQDRSPSQMRGTGFGAAFDPSTCDPNVYHKTQQSHLGTTISENISSGSASWSAYIDVQGGASGSPLIDPNSNYSLGIITHCSSSLAERISGTSTNSSDFSDVLNSFYDNNNSILTKISTPLI